MPRLRSAVKRFKLPWEFHVCWWSKSRFSSRFSSLLPRCCYTTRTTTCTTRGKQRSDTPGAVMSNWSWWDRVVLARMAPPETFYSRQSTTTVRRSSLHLPIWELSMDFFSLPGGSWISNTPPSFPYNETIIKTSPFSPIMWQNLAMHSITSSQLAASQRCPATKRKEFMAVSESFYGKSSFNIVKVLPKLNFDILGGSLEQQADSRKTPSRRKTGRGSKWPDGDTQKPNGRNADYWLGYPFGSRHLKALIEKGSA